MLKRMYKKAKEHIIQTTGELATLAPAKLRGKKDAIVPDDKRFFLADGGSLGSLSELAASLDAMPDDQFRSHVNDSKNDFANWIRDVFSKPELADSIQSEQDKQAMQAALLKHLGSKR